MKEKSPIEKELAALCKKEARIMKKAKQYKEAEWKEKILQRIPEKVYNGLQTAFYKAFEVIFEKGTGVIEKTYGKNEIQKDFVVRDYAFDLKEGRKELRKFKSDINMENIASLCATTAEGIGLGVLGVGIPDIILFVAMILRGTYITAIHYGFEYDTTEEKIFILKLLETSILKGDLWAENNQIIDEWIMSGQGEYLPIDDISLQIRKTADAFAEDMLLAKFIQGIPVIGVAGGIINPIYYREVLCYTQLKYRKRYLLQKQKNLGHR